MSWRGGMAFCLVCTSQKEREHLLMVIPCRLSDLEHDPDEPTSRKGPKRKQGGGGPSANVANLKAELRERLAEPLMARGVSARYPTSGSKVIIDDLLAEKGKWIHPMLPCL